MSRPQSRTPAPTQELDLRPGLDPGPRATAQLHEAAMDCRQDLVAAVDSVTARLGASPAWMYSAPAERNPLASDLPYRLAGLALVERLRAEGSLPARLVTDSRATSRALVRWAKANAVAVAVELRPTRSRLGRLKGTLADVLGTAAWQLWVKAAAGLSGRPEPAPDGPVILRDIFVLRDAPPADRYFPGLADHLRPEERRRTRLVPTVFGNGFRGFVTLFRRLRASQAPGEQYLLKEDHLAWSDCLAALAAPLTGLFARLGPVPFRGFDVGGMVAEELRGLRNYSSLVAAGLSERFAARLAEKGVLVERTLSWYENQAVDKGWQRGFSRHYPCARRVGYLGYVPPPLYLGLFPSQGERRAGVLPDELAVTGPALVDEVVRYCPDLAAGEARLGPGLAAEKGGLCPDLTIEEVRSGSDLPDEEVRLRPGLAAGEVRLGPGLAVTVAPAFRFAYLTGELPKAEPAPGRVVVPLPMNAADALRVFALVARAARVAALAEATFLVKAHPAMDPRVLSPVLDQGLPDNVRLVDQPVAELLPGGRALVGTASSVCVEALCLGVPVALLARPGGILLNPLPQALHGRMWRLCLTQDDLNQTLNEFVTQDEALRQACAEDAETLRRGLFAPVTGAGARALLGLAAPQEPAPPQNRRP